MKSCALMSLFLFCGFLALVGGAILLRETNPAIQAQRQADLLYRQERDRLDLESRRRQEQQIAELTTALLPFVKLAGAGLLVGIPLAAAGIAVSLVLENRRRRQLVFIADGVPPLSFDRVVAGDYPQLAAMSIAGHYAAEVARAQNPVPPSLPKDLRTYAPRYAPPKVAAPPSLPNRPGVELPATGVAIAPSMTALLQDQVIGPGRPLILGFAEVTGRPIVGDLKTIYSSAVGGFPGSGKTVTCAFIVAQAVLAGATIAVVDPHADADGSLAQTLAPLRPVMALPPASDDREILQVVDYARGELQQRLHGSPGAPLVVTFDEWTSLVRRSRIRDTLTAFVELVAQEGRKAGVYCLLAGQNWSVDAAGGSPLRDALASAFVHRSRPTQARVLVPGIDSQEVAKLPPGRALLYTSRGDLERVAIPMVRRGDLDRVVELLPPPSDWRPTTDPRASWQVLRTGSEPVRTGENAPETTWFEGDDAEPVRTGDAEPPLEATGDWRDQRIVDLARQGMSRNSIAKVVFGFKNGDAMRQIREVLAQAGVDEPTAEEG